MAFCSTVVIFVGVQIKISGLENQLFKFSFCMNNSSNCSVTAISAITPPFNGWCTLISFGVRPTIWYARSPTAITSPLRSSSATSDGSFKIIPRSFKNTKIFAVPKSIPISRTMKVSSLINVPSF